MEIKMKKITVLGSTGSIGTQALDVIRRYPEQFCVEALTCGYNMDVFEKQIQDVSPRFAAVAEEKEARRLSSRFPKVEFSYGRKGLIDAAANTQCDLVLNSLMGMRGLEPTYQAILAGKDIALANKETLVAGGELIMSAAKKFRVNLLPVDSEHGAVFQCLQGNRRADLEKILLTASGGPFRGWSRDELSQVTVKQALAHPNWKMGNKITVDSATLMNKGLEVIEACWLFGLKPEQVQVVVHPESIIHSMVQYRDRSIIAQLGVADMRIPISYALSYPDRLENQLPEVDFFQLGSLTFQEADRETFPCLRYAYDAMKMGGSACAVMNGANEVLVDLFLQNKIGFLDIPYYVKQALDRHQPVFHSDLEEILEIDQKVREDVLQWVSQ